VDAGKMKDWGIFVSITNKNRKRNKNRSRKQPYSGILWNILKE
jgi:hypothetical protein